MANEIPPVPYKEPLADQNGNPSPVWGRWFERVRYLIQTASSGGGAVDSVNGHTGVVVLAKSDVGLPNVDNTADSAKPVSVAQATAIALKVDKTTTVNGHALSANVTVTKSDVSLGNVDNTADSAKPVSTAQQTALDLKANIASPTFTGVPAAPTATAGTNTTQLATTAFVQGQGFINSSGAPVQSVNGYTGSPVLAKADVGLGNVDNTSDSSKLTATGTFQNKTIAASQNTITGLTNTNLSGTAGITNANLANMATQTFKGRTTAGTGAPEDLTVTQATALLNAVVGDSGSGGTKGLVPAPAAGDTAAAKFLKADGTWAAPPSGFANPMTTSGDIIYGAGSGAATRLAKGTDGQTLKLASGLPAWGFDLVTASKTGAYSATSSDDVIPVSGASAAFTVTLPTAVGISGKRYTIVRTDTTLANAVTIGTTSSQTINGTTTKKLATQYESLTVESDGANWYIVNRFIPSELVSYTPTITGFGTPTNVNFKSRRQADCLEVFGSFTSGTATAVAAQVTLGACGGNANVTIDTTKMPITANVVVGYAATPNFSSTSFFSFAPLATGAFSYLNFGMQSSTSTIQSVQNAFSLAGSGQTITFYAKVPISGWEG